MLDVTRPVRTVEGRPARIVCSDILGTPYPIVAAITADSGIAETVHTYTREGRVLVNQENPSIDLENIPETRTVWINIYRDLNDWCVHSSKEDADENAMRDRVRCVEFTYTL